VGPVPEKTGGQFWREVKTGRLGDIEGKVQDIMREESRKKM
jgi:hypothetical protein